MANKQKTNTTNQILKLVITQSIGPVEILKGDQSYKPLLMGEKTYLFVLVPG